VTDPAPFRRSYERGHLDEATVAGSWLEQLQRWFAEASADAAVIEPNAIALSTADSAGRPAVRMVLVKGIDERGIVFYTNYASAKARDLDANPYAAAVFPWHAQERQVRITGSVSRATRAETEAYFATRPRESQLGAWSSPQSQVVVSREVLTEAFEEVRRRFDGAPVPAPEGWGGYRISPDTVEFWQGRPGRLHDRIRFRRLEAHAGSASEGWIRERLAP
jgi:pyridoxamine 5'-phosphate oxidase